MSQYIEPWIITWILKNKGNKIIIITRKKSVFTWFLIKLNLKSVSPIRHLWIAMHRWKNLLVDSGLRSQTFRASVDELQGGCPSWTLAALFWRICNLTLWCHCSYLPKSNRGKIRALYKLTRFCSGNRFPILNGLKRSRQTRILKICTTTFKLEQDMFWSIYGHLQLKMYYLQLKMIVDRSKHVLF